MVEDRWELGSLFDLARWEPGGERGVPPWESRESRLVGSGRDALLLALVARPSRRLWVPSYLCQEVVAAVAQVGVTVMVYADSPIEPPPALDDLPTVAGDAVLVVNYFGLREGQRSTPGAGVVVIEDHTHGPCSNWARSSSADFCVASLRKLYPLPDGGVIWSPRAHALPSAPGLRSELALASARKLEGMILKRLYLDGHTIDKESFRGMLAAGEESLFFGAPSAMTPLSREMLAVFPLAAWQRERRANFDAFAATLPPIAGLRLHRPVVADDVPFSALLELDGSARRDRLHDRMCRRRLYASALWPLDSPELRDIPPAHRELARRLLSIPIDMRYRSADLERAAGIVASSAAAD